MERIVANLASSRRTVRDSRGEHIVAPIRLIVPGVLNGSGGPLLYPKEEVALSTQLWNHIPLVVNHPESGSARNPEVLDKVGIGKIFNAKIEDGVLVAEGWFNVERTAKVSPQIFAALKADKPIEVSTGLVTKNDVAPEGAELDGKPYSFIARNYRPDHLAILPDSVGACSVADGCGVLNKTEEFNTERIKSAIEKYMKGDSAYLPIKESEMDKTKIVDELIANSCCWSEEDRETLNSLDEAKLKRLQTEAQKTQELITTNEAAVKAAEEKLSRVPSIAVWNEERGAWDVKSEEETVKNAEAKKKAEEQAAVANKALEEYKAEIADKVAFADSEMTRQKAGLADRLVANLEDNAAKTAQRERLMARSLDDLRQDAALLPVQENAPMAPSYMGAATPVANVKEVSQDSFASFGLPDEYIDQEK